MTASILAPEFVRGEAALDVDKPAEHDERYWSVTTINGVLDKAALQYWAAEQVAIAAVKSRATWQAMEQENGPDEAIDWLKKARFRPPRGQMAAADFGTAVHAVFEDYTLTGVKPTPSSDVFGPIDLPLAQACLDQFDRWLQAFQPVYRAAEVTVFNRTYGYAGQADNFLDVGGVRFIGDYKIARDSFDKRGKPKPIYPETALQLVGYSRAELAAVWRPRRFEAFKRRYYLLSQAEVSEATTVPDVEMGLGIKVSPDYCMAYPLRIDDAVWDAFLYVLETARWTFELSKTAVGEPLTAPVGAHP